MTAAPLPVPDRRRHRWLAAGLFVVVAAVFLPTVTHTFIPYDDPTYITQNPHVTGGLTAANVRWAFTSIEASNWHPLTWLSHMLDCQLFGANPAGHHLTSVLLHAFNAALLFVVLVEMTSARWPSLAAAALFGLHPLHVESVAWAAERKDVLSTAFGLLALWAWAMRARRRRDDTTGSARLYGAALLFFAASLMAKPMLVTLPCLLLLLDFWPLGRWRPMPVADKPPGRRDSRLRLVWEKLPFAVLSAASCAITLHAQSHGNAVASVEDFTPAVRVSTALLAYAGYLGKCFWPAKLAVFYPNFADLPPLSHIAVAAGLLLVISVAAVVFARSRPWLLVGWLWFLGTLVPVIGFVQIGGQAMADRYTYVPLIGIFIAVAWTVAALPVDWVRHRTTVLGTTGVIAIALVVLTTRQLAFWRDPVRLFRHAESVTEKNWIAHTNLFIALRQTAPAEAQTELQAALRIIADFSDRYDRRGLALAQQPGREEQAAAEFRTAIRIMKTRPMPHFHLAQVLERLPGREEEAIAEYRETTGLQPDFAPAYFALGVLLSRDPQRLDACIDAFQAVVALDPGSFEAQFNLGLMLARVPWRSGEALLHVEEALKLRPDSQPAREMVERLRAAP